MRLTQKLICGAIRGYQVVVSPLLHLLAGPYSGCRFQPTCSEYARQAIETHGAAHGSLLALRRICRCHPWGGCGCDPVPPNTKRIGVKLG
jgi:hypothetical protein